MTTVGAIRHLVVVHYHLRPGGVRRVIELTLPEIVRSAPTFNRVTLLVGESASGWVEDVRASVAPCRLDVVVEPYAGYVQELNADPELIRSRIDETLRGIMRAGEVAAIWLHNPGLGRNLLLVASVNRCSADHGVPVVFHHHDLWFENRWRRGDEMGRCGFETLDSIANQIFGVRSRSTHVFINGLDATMGARHLAPRTSWIPNPVSRGIGVTDQAIEDATGWLCDQLGEVAPIWMFPTRFLRRKNLAEAILLTRWLRPDAWFVTTADVSSREECRYAEMLEAAAEAGGWRTRFRMLAGSASDRPPFVALVAAAEVLLMTSVQEGFGLPYFEAAAAGKPLIARALPNVAPDLERLGFRFPHLYNEVWIDRSLMDCDAERERQRQAWTRWRGRLPEEVREMAESPRLWDGDAAGPVAFSRLTLEAQLEVLARPGIESWSVCEGYNSFLSNWKSLADRSRLGVAEWPSDAEQSLGLSAYARKFWEAVESVGCIDAAAAQATQRGFIAERLGARFQFPILFGEGGDSIA